MVGWTKSTPIVGMGEARFEYWEEPPNWREADFVRPQLLKMFIALAVNPKKAGSSTTFSSGQEGVWNASESGAQVFRTNGLFPNEVTVQHV